MKQHAHLHVHRRPAPFLSSGLNSCFLSAPSQVLWSMLLLPSLGGSAPCSWFCRNAKREPASVDQSRGATWLAVTSRQMQLLDSGQSSRCDRIVSNLVPREGKGRHAGHAAIQCTYSPLTLLTVCFRHALQRSHLCVLYELHRGRIRHSGHPPEAQLPSHGGGRGAMSCSRHARSVGSCFTSTRDAISTCFLRRQQHLVHLHTNDARSRWGIACTRLT